MEHQNQVGRDEIKISGVGVDVARAVENIIFMVDITKQKDSPSNRQRDSTYHMKKSRSSQVGIVNEVRFNLCHLIQKKKNNPRD